MIRRFHCFAALTLAALASLAAGPATAEERVDHPKLRAALHELRDARRGLQGAKDNWPPGYRDRALASTQEAIKSVMIILAVKDVDSFRGVEREPDYYKRYNDHARLRAALDDLRDARDELRTAKADFRGEKDRALDSIDVAVGDIVTLIRYKPRQ